jgi:hypothetical protein
MVGISARLEELGIAGCTRHVLGRSGADGTDEAPVARTEESVVDLLDPDHMVPVVAEV